MTSHFFPNYGSVRFMSSSSKTKGAVSNTRPMSGTSRETSSANWSEIFAKSNGAIGRLSDAMSDGMP